MKMKLYEFGPTRSIRVRWTLQELGADFESIRVNLLAGEHRHPELLKIMTGTVDIIEKGSEFDKANALLEAKFQQYNELFPIREGESVILCFKPTKAVTWDYVVGELHEPH
jgi:hypothetical protein